MIGPAFGIQPERDGDALEQGGFPGAVLADEERHRRVEGQLGEVTNRGDRIRIVSRRGAERPLPANGLDEDPGDGGGQLGAAPFHWAGYAPG